MVGVNFGRRSPGLRGQYCRPNDKHDRMPHFLPTKHCRCRLPRRFHGYEIDWAHGPQLLKAGKRRLASDKARGATPSEVNDLRREATAMKEVAANLTLENRLLKNSMSLGRTRHEISCVRES
jgi:hypothetical protein